MPSRAAIKTQTNRSTESTEIVLVLQIQYGRCHHQCRPCRCRASLHARPVRPFLGRLRHLRREILQLRLAPRQGHLVRPAQRRRPRRQRWRLRVQERERVPVLRHDVVRQRAPLPGRRRLRHLLPDTVHQNQQPGLLRPGQDGGDHGHELLPGGQVPLRPQRHGVRRAGDAGPQRPAPARGHHRHAVQESALQLPGHEAHIQGSSRRQPQLPPGARPVRQPGRHGGEDGPDALQERPPHGPVGAHVPLLGLRLAVRHQGRAPGAAVPARHQRVREDARGQQCHPGWLEGRHQLLLQHPVLIAHFIPSTLI